MFAFRYIVSDTTSAMSYFINFEPAASSNQTLVIGNEKRDVVVSFSY